MNPKLQLALMVTAVTCAVVMTLLVLKREIGSPSSQRDEGVQVDGLAMLIESAPHASGPTDATVTIVEFFDLQCPACRQFSLSMDSVRSSGRHSIRIVRHHYPLTTIHPMAQDLALVGLCLGDSALFDDYYRRAYELQGLLGSRASVGPMQLLPAGTDTTAIRQGAGGVTFNGIFPAGQHSPYLPTDLLHGWGGSGQVGNLWAAANDVYAHNDSLQFSESRSSW